MQIRIHRHKFRGVRAVCFPLYLLIGGCTAPYWSPVIEPDTAEFPGIMDFAINENAAAAPSNVLSIHGMCTHDHEWARYTGERMAMALSLTVQSFNRADNIDIPGTSVWISTLANEFGEVSVTNYALVWSQLTTPEKSPLCEDSDEATKSCPKPLFDKPRATLNGWTKSQLLNDCLSDALIYSNKTKGQEIRSAIRSTIAQLFTDDINSSPPLFIIVESLASKILRDAVSLDENTREKSAATAALLPTRQIFMAANQIPLLDIAIPPVADAQRAPYKTPAVVELRDILQRKRDEMARSMNLDPLSNEPINVVAFSDPNDLLSYHIPNEVLRNVANVTNVTVSNTPTWLGQIADPLGAHQGYLSNRSVWELIACGSDRDCEP